MFISLLLGYHFLTKKNKVNKSFTFSIRRKGLDLGVEPPPQATLGVPFGRETGTEQKKKKKTRGRGEEERKSRLIFLLHPRFQSLSTSPTGTTTGIPTLMIKRSCLRRGLGRSFPYKKFCKYTSPCPPSPFGMTVRRTNSANADVRAPILLSPSQILKLLNLKDGFKVFYIHLFPGFVDFLSRGERKRDRERTALTTVTSVNVTQFPRI